MFGLVQLFVFLLASLGDQAAPGCLSLPTAVLEDKKAAVGGEARVCPRVFLSRIVVHRPGLICSMNYCPIQFILPMLAFMETSWPGKGSVTTNLWIFLFYIYSWFDSIILIQSGAQVHSCSRRLPRLQFVFAFFLFLWVRCLPFSLVEWERLSRTWRTSSLARLLPVPVVPTTGR